MEINTIVDSITTDESTKLIILAAIGVVIIAIITWTIWRSDEGAILYLLPIISAATLSFTLWVGFRNVDFSGSFASSFIALTEDYFQGKIVEDSFGDDDVKAIVDEKGYASFTVQVGKEQEDVIASCKDEYVTFYVRKAESIYVPAVKEN